MTARWGPRRGRLNVLIADDHPDVVLLLRKITKRYLRRGHP